MILIVKMLGDTNAKRMWDAIIRQQDDLQSSLGRKGKLLYLSKRRGYNEACLFIHVKDSGSVIELVVEHLSKIEGISSLCIAHLFRPRFFPVPKDTYDMKRYVITAKVNPRHFTEVYKKLLNPNLPEGLKRVYYAFTFHSYDDNLQYSFLADNEESAQKYVNEKINTVKGIIIADLHQIERTKAFIPYKEWVKYTSQEESSTPGQYHMINDVE
ncbi:MAG: hypothetical protein JW832_16640 [Deltaproteobacteria bacterium]|nr:hypothetical protein [Deltaproteobacteria bacterium]